MLETIETVERKNPGWKFIYRAYNEPWEVPEQRTGEFHYASFWDASVDCYVRKDKKEVEIWYPTSTYGFEEDGITVPLLEMFQKAGLKVPSYKIEVLQVCEDETCQHHSHPAAVDVAIIEEEV